MKHKLISLFTLILLLLSEFAVAFKPAAAQSALTYHLAAFWKMDELSGVRGDSVGTLLLTAAGTVTPLTGKHTNAAQIAAGASLGAPDTPTLSIANTTLAGWVQFSSMAPTSSIIASKANEYTLEVVNGQWRFTVYGSGGTPVAQAVSIYSPPLPDTWYFVAIWHHADSDQAGILLYNVVNIVSTAGDAADTTSPFVLGSATNTVVIDTLGVWRRVLSPAELSALYHNGSGCDYPFTACAPMLTPTLSLTATLTLSPTPTPTPKGWDEFESDNTQSQARQIVIEESQRHTFYTPGGLKDVDWVYVTLKPGAWRISARTENRGPYDPRFTVYRNGQALVQADDEEGKNAAAVLMVSDPGLYYIAVDNLGVDTPEGAYALTVERLPPTNTPTFTPTAVPPTPRPTLTDNRTSSPAGARRWGWAGAMMKQECMSCDRCVKQCQAALQAAGVPESQAKAVWAGKNTTQDLKQKIDGYLDHLAQLTDQARISDEMQRYLQTLACFHKYSRHNLISILLHRPDATHVAGFKTWQNLGRWVKKAKRESPLWSRVPIAKKPESPTPRPATNKKR